MAEGSQPAVDGVPLWPALLTQWRRAMRAVVDRRLWWPPILLWIVIPAGDWALRQWSGAPQKPPITGQWWTDVLLGLAISAMLLFMFPFGVARLLGGRATLGEAALVALWAAVPALLASLPLDAIGLALFGADWWTIAATRTSRLAQLSPAAIGLQLVRLLIGAWGLALLLVGLSEVHQIDGKRILLAVLLPLFLLGVVAAIATAILVAQGAAVR